MNYSLDNYDTFIIASANIKYLSINLIKIWKTSTHTPITKNYKILLEKNLNLLGYMQFSKIKK